MDKTYLVTIVAATICLAVLTNVRIGYVMSKRWGLSFDPGTLCVCIGSGVATCAIAWVGSLAIIKTWGLMAGLIAVPMSVPAVGLAWLFLVGGNKAIEKLLTSLMKRVA